MCVCVCVCYQSAVGVKKENLRHLATWLETSLLERGDWLMVMIAFSLSNINLGVFYSFRSKFMKTYSKYLVCNNFYLHTIINHYIITSQRLLATVYYDLISSVFKRLDHETNNNFSGGLLSSLNDPNINLSTNVYTIIIRNLNKQ